MSGINDVDDLVAVLSRLHERRAFWSIFCTPLTRPHEPYGAHVDTRVPGTDWQEYARGATIDEALIRANDGAERREREHVAAGGELH